MDSEKLLQTLNLNYLVDYTLIYNYEYKYTLYFLDGQIIKNDDSEKLYYNINNKEIKIIADNNIFNNGFKNQYNVNIKKKYYQKKCREYLEKIICLIPHNKFSYEIKLSYNYISREIMNSNKYNNYYFEINICCFDKLKKISQELTYSFKDIDYSKITNILNNMAKRNSYNIDTKIGIIEPKRIIFESYAFSQLINKIINIMYQNKSINNKKISLKSTPLNKKLPHYMLFDNNANMLNDFDILKPNNKSYNKNFENCIFDYYEKTDDLKKEIKSGYIITKIYFSYGAVDKNKNIVKAQCCGVYLKNSKIVSVFSNKLITIDILSLLNNVKKVSSDKIFSNNILCPDVLIDFES